MGVTVAQFGIELHLLQGLDGSCIAFARGHRGFMDQQAFGYDLPGGHARRQGAERILQDHLDLFPQRAHVLRVQLGNVLAFEGYGTFTGNKPEKGACEGGFARTGFPHDADGLAFFQRNRHAVNRFEQQRWSCHETTTKGECDGDIRAIQNLWRVGSRWCLAARWLSIKQRLGVGMFWIGKNGFGITLLHHFAITHDHHAAGNAFDDIEVVGDEDHAHAEAFLQRRHEFQDFGLNSDVEGGGWLVGDEKVGIVGKRHGDHYALALATGHLMGV